MKLVGKVPVEPLDDERLTNIERNLVVQVSEMSQRPRGVRAPWRLLAFAGMAMAVLLAGFVGWRVRGEGTPIIAPPRPEYFAMKAGALDLGDAQIIGKDFTVTRSPGRVDIEMVRAGKLDLHVDHKPERLFVVKAGAVEIEDVGTRFTVDFDGKNVDVRVTEGEVKVKHAGKELSVTAGNAWTIELGPITIAALEENQQAALVAQAQVPDPVDVVGAAGSGSGAVRSGNGGPSGAGSNDAAGGNGGSGAGQGSGKRRAGGPDAKKALEKWPDEPLVESEETDPKKASHIYVTRASQLPEGEDKANLLQSSAVMHLRAKNYDAARRIVEGILHERRASNWRAYQEALWLDVRAKCLASRARGPTFDDACRIAAEKFLVKFPDGAKAGIAQQVLNEI